MRPCPRAMVVGRLCGRGSREGTHAPRCSVTEICPESERISTYCIHVPRSTHPAVLSFTEADQTGAKPYRSTVKNRSETASNHHPRRLARSMAQRASLFMRAPCGGRR
ncbi:hypothetical protein EJB05_43040, partial [Eragrostis curvula]